MVQWMRALVMLRALSSYTVVTFEYNNIYEKTLKALYLLSEIFLNFPFFK